MSEQVQRLMGDIFLTKVPITSVTMLTVSRVEMTKDLCIARIYVSLLEPKTGEQEVMRELFRNRKVIRYHLGSALQAKYVPELRFHLDKSLERSSKIHALLENIQDGSGEGGP